MPVNPTDPEGDFRTEDHKDSEQISSEIVAAMNGSSEEEGQRKAEEYERDKIREAMTPEEDALRPPETAVDPKSMGVGASSIGDEIYEKPEDQIAHDARLARGYREGSNITVYKTESRGDDNRGFRRADDRSRGASSTENELEQELRKAEDQIEKAGEREDRSLARDVDREPITPE